MGIQFRASILLSFDKFYNGNFLIKFHKKENIRDRSFPLFLLLSLFQVLLMGSTWPLPIWVQWASNWSKPAGQTCHRYWNTRFESFINQADSRGDSKLFRKNLKMPTQTHTSFACIHRLTNYVCYGENVYKQSGHNSH